jgi:hypothetical protein
MLMKLQLLLPLLVVILLAACDEHFSDAPKGNLAPETHLAVVFADSLYPDTTASKVSLHWWGQDEDGLISGYQYHWSYMEEDDPLQPEYWVTTEVEQDTFYLPLRQLLDDFTFSVRALDEDSLFDPSPATVTLTVENTPPEIAFLANSVESDLDTLFTFPRKTFYWTAYDLDGYESIVATEYALDDTSEWFPTNLQFTQLVLENGSLTPGSHHFYLRSRDIAGMFSETLVFPELPDSGEVGMVWMVLEPVADLLVIDDEDNRYFDEDRNYYFDLLDQMGVQYQFIDYTLTYPYSEGDLLATLEFFPQVFWFSGPSSQLYKADETLVRYMSDDHGLIVNSFDLGESYSNNPPFAFTHIDTMLSNRVRISPNYDINPLRSGFPVLRSELLIPGSTDADYGFLPDSNCAVLYDQEAYASNPQVNLAVRYPDEGRPQLFAFQLPLHLCDDYANMDSLFTRMLEEFNQ